MQKKYKHTKKKWSFSPFNCQTFFTYVSMLVLLFCRGTTTREKRDLVGTLCAYLHNHCSRGS